jgi:aspartyl/asparaginyl-tRNA synthetase
MTRTPLFGRAAGTLVPLVVATACATMLATSIGEIKANPGKHHGERVTLRGTVADTTDLVVVKFFMLRDESGEIAVVTSAPLPDEGTKVTVKGTVNQAFSVAGTSLVVVIEAPPAR